MTTIIFLRTYAANSKCQTLESLVAQGLKEGFLSEDISDVTFDNEEYRFFGDSIDLSYKVFRQPVIKFRNSKEVNISNSIILGDLAFSSEIGPLKVCLDECIIAKDIRFWGSEIKDVHISACNASSVHFFGTIVESSYFANCRIGNLRFIEAEIHKLNSFCSSINNIEKRLSKIGEFKSVGDSINLEGILRHDISPINDLHVFKENTTETMIDAIDDPNELKIETITFLKQSDLFLRKRRLGHLADIELSSLAEKSRLNRFVVRSLAGFTEPSVFFVVGLIIILTFAFGYSFWGALTDGKQEYNSFLDALYFSGITFTTIGYGDIHPTGFTRLFTVVEGLLGILTCSGFLVALVNKYTKNN